MKHLDDNALTEREWHLVKLWAANKMPGGRVRGMVVLDLPDDHRRGAAAVALYNEPYGFTHADVRGLRMLAAAHIGIFEGSLNKLADRIEALLPPDTEKNAPPSL